MSGMGNKERDAQTAGFADAFLFKPFKTGDLLATVLSLLEPAAGHTGS
jgi:hypothetical protein